MILFVDPDEEKSLDLGGGCVIRYKEAPGDAVTALEREFRDEDGLPDWSKAANAMIERFVTGWEGVTDAEGTDIPYTAATAKKLAPLMRGAPKLRLRYAIEAVYAEGKAPSAASDDDSNG